MSGRTSLEIKKLILESLAECKPRSYAQLERKIGSNWETIRTHCKELEIFECIKIASRESHDKNNKPYTEISITKQGIKVLKKLK